MRSRAPDKRTKTCTGKFSTQLNRGADRSTVQVYMTTELFKRVRKEALANGRTLAGQFRHMAESYLEAKAKADATETRYFGEVPL